MLNSLGDITTEFLVRMNTSTTVAFSDTMVKSWLNQAYAWTASFHKWPFTERRDNTITFTGVEENNYPSDFRTNAIRLLQIDGKRLQKLAFEDYQIFREQFPDRNDKVWASYGRSLFINPFLGISGTLTAWGQYTPVPLDVTDPTATTVFSEADEEGNDAVVEKMLSYAKLREKKIDEAQAHDQRASILLEQIWKRCQDEQFMAHPIDRGIFGHFDVLTGRGGKMIDENQFGINI